MAMTAWLAKLSQLDLLVAERPDFGTVDHDRSDQIDVPEHRDSGGVAARRQGAATRDAGDRVSRHQVT